MEGSADLEEVDLGIRRRPRRENLPHRHAERPYIRLPARAEQEEPRIWKNQGPKTLNEVEFLRRDG